ncbi:DUF2934 domain-containing protein [bacterium]|nr:DUF2934 domain-containing protein [bacterium]
MATARKSSAPAGRKVNPKRISQSATVNEIAIRERAYQLFEARGFEHGHDIEDWVAAEKELKKRK